jgi:hypothetical protein
MEDFGPFCVRVVKPKFDFSRTCRMALFIVKCSIYVICFADLFEALSCWRPLCFPFFSDFQRSLCAYTGSNEMLSAISLFMLFGGKFGSMCLAVFLLSPYFGSLGTICAMCLVYANSSPCNRFLWSLWIGSIVIFVLLRFVAHRYRRIVIYQWDECIACD